jgi:hypothetical protein
LGSGHIALFFVLVNGRGTDRRKTAEASLLSTKINSGSLPSLDQDQPDSVQQCDLITAMQSQFTLELTQFWPIEAWVSCFSTFCK